MHQRIVEIRDEIVEKQHQIKESKQNCRKCLYEAQENGAKSNQMLHEQNEQIRHIKELTYGNEKNLMQAQGHIHRMRNQWRYCFFGWLPFCRPPKTKTLRYDESPISVS